jgi:hypothetical protein
VTVPPLVDEPLVDPLTEVIDEVLGGLVSGGDTGD